MALIIHLHVAPGSMSIFPAGTLGALKTIVIDTSDALCTCADPRRSDYKLLSLFR